MTRGKQARSIAVSAAAIIGLFAMGTAASGMLGRLNADAPPKVKSVVTKVIDGHAVIKVGFTERVNAIPKAFRLECPLGTIKAMTMNTTSPAGRYTLTTKSGEMFKGQNCRLTVIKTRVMDTDTNDPPNRMLHNFVLFINLGDSWTAPPGGSTSTSITTTTTTTPVVDTAPTVSSTSPANGATRVNLGANIVVNFSEAVTATGSSFTLACPTGSPQPFAVSGSPGTAITLNPTSDLPAGTVCSVNVVAAQIHDTDSNDPPDTLAADYAFSFTTNRAPTDIALTNSSVAENQPSGTPVGTLSATDADAGDSHTFSLVAGTGSDDNSSFSIFGAELRTAASFDYETKSSYTIRVRATDAGGLTYEEQLTITVTNANEAPTVTTSGGSTSYTEGSSATTIDGALTVTDGDDANLEGAVVRVSANFEAGDDLVFVNQNGISGVYNTGTGVLTLTGTSSVANYQTALRSIQFQNLASDNPATSKTIEFKVNDGDVDSLAATKNISVTRVNDGPTLTTTAGDSAYTEGGAAAGVDPALTVTDPDSTQFQGATVSITSNFTSADGDTLNFVNQNGITGVYNSGTGVLTLTGPATVANYRTALRSVTFSNTSDNPSTATRTVSFQATDFEGAASNVATRNVLVATANDAPVVTTSAGNTSYTEGDPATAVDGALTVTDADDTNLEGATVRISANFQSGDDLVFVNQNGISGVYNTGTGVLTLTGAASKADYETGLRSIQYQHTGDNPSASKTVEFKVNDGDSDSNAATKNISISEANDAPTLTTTATALSYAEGSGPQAVDNGLTATDSDSPNFGGATVQITANFVSADDELAFTNQNGISGAYNDSTGTLTLSGTSSVANYQTALRSVTYENASDNPSGTKTVSFQATDSGGAASNVATRDINFTAANDAPVVTTSGGDTAYTEGDPATTIDGALTVTDADDANLEGGQVRLSSGFQSGDDLVFVNQNGISGVYNTGTGVLTLTGTSSVANYQTALRSIQFQSTNGAPVASKTVEFKVNDGDSDSNAPTKEITVTAANSAPALTTTGTPLAYSEGSGAVAIDPGLTATDADSANFGGATVQITSNFVGADDELAFTDTATITGVYNDSTGKLTLSGTDTIANYQAALRSVTFENVNQNPSGSKTVTFQATDAEGADSNLATRNIDLTNVNDAPVVTTSAGNAAYTEDGPAATIDGALTVTDVDDTNIESGQVRVSSGFEAGDDLVFVNQNGISGVYNTGTGVLTLTGSATVANYQTALRSIKFQTTNNNPSVSRTVEFKVNDGSADSNLATKNIDVTPTNDPPVADDETFNGANSAVGNTGHVVDDPSDGPPNPSYPHKTITGDILAGDADPDTPAGDLTVTPGTFATNDGGSVTIESDGDFTFHPAAATSCTDTSDFFDYTVEDNDADPVEKTDTGRVTIAITGCVWYVSNSASGNSGTSNAPFDTLAQAETASGANQTVFVFDGDNTSTGYGTGYAMDSGERLIGESEGLTVGTDTLQAPNAGAVPSLAASGEDVVQLNAGNEVRGFNLDPSGAASGGIAGGALDASGTIANVNIADTGTAGLEPGLELDGTSGTWNISNLTVDNSAATAPGTNSKGVYVHGAGTVNFASAGTISINQKGAAGLDADTVNMGTGSVFDSITVGGSGSGGIRLFNTTGTTQLGDGSGADLNLVTTSGTTAALLVSNGGTVSVPNSGTATISATGGPAVDITGTPGISLALDTVSSTNSATDGVKLNGLGTGTFTALSGGTISGATGTSFAISGASSGDITYPGTLGNGPGQGVSVTGRTGGTVTFSGPLQDTSDAGGGITVSTSTGGSTVFSNSVAIDTTTSAGGGNPVNNGVVFSASDGHTLTFSGGLTINSFGRGLQADTSGTLNVTGGSNSISSITGIALDVSNTDVGASPLSFQSISAGNNTAAADPANGIVLSNTGSNNALTVASSGSGTCSNASQAGCTGGTIQNTIGADSSSVTPGGTGLVLNGTRGVSLTRMYIHDHSNYGIRGNNVVGLTLAESVISGANGTDDTGAVHDGATYFTDLNGTVSVTNTDIGGGRQGNFIVDNNASGTLNATLDGVDFGTVSTTGGDDAVRFNGVANTSTTMNVVVNNTTFTSARGDIFQWVADGTGGGGLTFTNNTVANTNPAISNGGGGVTLTAGARATATLNVDNNDFSGSHTSAITINKSRDNAAGAGTLTGTINNNDIGVIGTANSGSLDGAGIEATHFGESNYNLTITNNRIHQYNSFGLSFISGGGIPESGNFNLNISGNTISTPGTNPGVTLLQGIGVNSGVAAGDTFQTCVNFGANSITGASDAANKDFRLRARQNTTVRLPGYAGAATSPGADTAVPAFVSSKVGGGAQGTALTADAGQFIGTGTTCP